MRLSRLNMLASLRRSAALLMLFATAAAGAEAVVPDECDGDGAALQVMVFSADLPTDAPSGPLPSHALHLCHCSHSHAGATPAGRRATVAPTALQLILRADESFPTSQVAEPPLRPPAA